jgi:hypothetical protein
VLFVRLLALLALIGIGGSLIAWFVTGDAKYRLWAWYCFQIGIVILLVLLGIFAIERLLTPL